MFILRRQTYAVEGEYMALKANLFRKKVVMFSVGGDMFAMEANKCCER